MKKLILTVILIISVFTLTNAQFTKIGGGLALSSGFPFHNMSWDYNKSGKIAVSLKGIYEISVPFHISPSFTIFYPHITKNATEKTIVSSMMFDINGHYVFNSLDKYEFYGLAGLDFLFAKKKQTYTASPSNTESDNALGLNLGVGTYMKITEQFDLYGEAKYIFNNKYNQFMLNLGILVNIDWLKKNENSGL
ncbi:MAG: autotransporter outer membrane beta-barrel domain-containing protein [Bacteroidetes bacterium]|nr:MAG: autotransporter outer membrane beta-barrel domain-containing protein [Bacteroidota bacterium]